MLATFDIQAGPFAHAADLFAEEPARVERDLRTLTQKRAKMAKQAFQRATPVSHPEGDEPEHEPHMASLWHQETTGPSESIVFNEAGYSSFLFSGTKRHQIRARPGHMLRFYAGGSLVFTQEVSHPGTLPNPRLLKALEDQLTKAQGDLFDYGVAEMAHLAEEVR